MLLTLVAGTCSGAEAAVCHARHDAPAHRAGEHEAEHNRFDIHALSCNAVLSPAQGTAHLLSADACLGAVPSAAGTLAVRPGPIPPPPRLARALGPPAFLRHAALLI